ncbi:hypothetical protein [Cellulomonas sp. URHB0016]
MTPARTGRRTLTAAVLTAVLVTAGCGARTDLDADRAVALQDAVLDVTSAAATGQWDAAEAALADTRARLDEGVDDGQVSTARYREIDEALDRVTGAVAAARAQAEAAQAAAAQAAAEQAAADQAAAEQAAAAQAAAEQAATDQGAAPHGPKPAPPPADKGHGKHGPKP